jgi:hypothetical protein
VKWEGRVSRDEGGVGLAGGRGSGGGGPRTRIRTARGGAARVRRFERMGQRAVGALGALPDSGEREDRKEAVREVRFTVSRMVAEERWWDAAESRSVDERDAERVQPVVASDTERDQIRMMATAIHDERVREAVIAAAIRDLEWRKGIEARNAAHGGAERATEADSDAEH